jgi:hypothetical protein
LAIALIADDLGLRAMAFSLHRPNAVLTIEISKAYAMKYGMEGSMHFSDY